MPTYSDEQIQQLVERAKSNDPDAVAELYAAHFDRIYRYVAYRVPYTDVEDVTANIFVAMIRSLSQYIYQGAPFEAWLYALARVQVAKFYRYQRQDVELEEQLSDTKDLPEEQLLQNQELSELQIALAKLTELEQELLILRFVERLSHNELAKILKKTPQNLRIIQHRALHKLAQFLDAEGKKRHYLRGFILPKSDEQD